MCGRLSGAPRIMRIRRHASVSRFSPSLQRAVVSSSSADATLRKASASMNPPTRYSGRPSRVETGGSLIVLMTGSE